MLKYSPVLEARLDIAFFTTTFFFLFFLFLLLNEELGVHLLLHTLAFAKSGRFLSLLQLTQIHASFGNLANSGSSLSVFKLKLLTDVKEASELEDS